MNILLERVSAPLTVPASCRLFAFSQGGELQGAWQDAGHCDDTSSILLLAHTGEMRLHYALLDLFPAYEPHMNRMFHLGANAEVMVRAGCARMLFDLCRQSGNPDQLTLEGCYPCLQKEVTSLYREHVLSLTQGRNMGRGDWEKLLPELDSLVWPRLQGFLWRHGLIPSAQARILGLSDICIPRQA